MKEEGVCCPGQFARLISMAGTCVADAYYDTDAHEPPWLPEGCLGTSRTM